MFDHFTFTPDLSVLMCSDFCDLYGHLILTLCCRYDTDAASTSSSDEDSEGGGGSGAEERKKKKKEKKTKTIVSRSS